MDRKKKESTAEKIILASKKLFNEEGERNITTNHIADYLGISPGNLYYYFNNKDEIIMQLFERYRDDITQSFLVITATPNQAKEAIDFISSLFDIMWDYRFFFGEINTYLERNEKLKDLFNTFVEYDIVPNISAYIDNMRSEGILSINELDFKILRKNLWIIIKHWFLFDQSLRLNLDNTSKKRGILQVLGLIKPYIHQEHHLNYQDEIDHLYKEIQKLELN